MTRDLEHEVATLARFAGEVYTIADAALPDHLAWHVRLYDDPRHATPSPVAELRVTQGARGRSIAWMAEYVVYGEHESRWPTIIRDGIEKLRHAFAV